MANESRREFLAKGAAAVAAVSGAAYAGVEPTVQDRKRPNILFAIADDWSWPYASAYGTSGIKTPAFDRVAREGCLYTNAFAVAPQCSPNRAAILTGRNIWQLEEAGTHASIFPKKWPVWTELLEAAGYHCGFTGKAWGPGDWEKGGWTQNPAGPMYNAAEHSGARRAGISPTDYSANFELFLEARPQEAPFCFWFGAKEPHPTYETGSGLAAGKKLEEAHVPAFLPDHEIVRTEILDMCLEVEWFDAQLGKMLERLEAMGELDNTLIIVTSDNGISIPGAKANLREFGTHVPLAIRWPASVPGESKSDALVSSIDLAPSILQAAGLDIPATMTGKIFIGEKAAPQRQWLVTGRERHTHARRDNVGYPARAIRTEDHLYIWNLKPERWPAGDPEGYHDVDNGPTKTLMLEQRERFPELFQNAFAQRPEEELFDVRTDAACLHNLAADEAHATVRARLRTQLEGVLREEGDPRLVGANPDIFDSYPRVSEMRPQLGGFAERSTYNPAFQ